MFKFTMLICLDNYIKLEGTTCPVKTVRALGAIFTCNPIIPLQLGLQKEQSIL